MIIVTILYIMIILFHYFLIQVIYGIGRGTWESTNKAVIADLYVDTPNATTAAFASISFFNGLAGNLISPFFPLLISTTYLFLTMFFVIARLFIFQLEFIIAVFYSISYSLINHRNSQCESYINIDVMVTF